MVPIASTGCLLHKGYYTTSLTNFVCQVGCIPKSLWCTYSIYYYCIYIHYIRICSDINGLRTYLFIDVDAPIVMAVSLFGKGCSHNRVLKI